MKDYDFSLNKVPPQNIEAEQSVLGAILIENQAINIALEYIGQDDFYTEAHRNIFSAIVDLTGNGQPCDSVFLCDYLKGKGQLQAVGGQVYIGQLVDNTASAANIAHYCRLIKSKAAARSLIRTAGKIIEDVYFQNGNGIDQILDEAQRDIIRISSEGRQTNFPDTKNLVRKVYGQIEERCQNPDAAIGISTGLKDLDAITCGFQKAELIILAARPSMGKTALALQIATHSASNGIPAAFFSLEMSKESVTLRELSRKSRIDSRHMRKGHLTAADWPKLTAAADGIGRIPLFIDDTAALTTMEMKARARKLKIEKGIGLIIVDYLQLMRSSKKLDSREREISDISQSLKALAKELDIPVIACAQLNRQVENRPRKRPQMADLRESGAIEQDADLIMFLYRDEVYNDSPQNPEQGTAEVIIGKQRNGPIGVVKLAFDKKCTCFANLAPKREIPYEDNRYR